MAVRVRADLEYFAVSGYREPTWVVRDPLSRECFHLGEEEYFLLPRIDGQVSNAELCAQFSARFPERNFNESDLQPLLVDWLKKGLLLGPIHRFPQPSAASGKSRWGWLKNPLVIRFRGWDPQRFLNGLLPWCGWLYSPTFRGLSLLLILSAAVIAMTHLPEIAHESLALPLLFGPADWLLAIGCISLAKVLHEFGHGLTCHRYGGRCHEMGVMLLVGIPCLYCNVTDAWTFRRKRERLAVSGAGIAVDIWLASACLLAWHFSQPGVFHSLCLLLAILGSINSLLLNGNPLMRYDGYYLLADWLGEPNFRTRAMRQTRRTFWRTLFGTTSAPVEQLRAGLVAYGAAAGVYLWLILFVILSSVYFALQPYGMENLVVAFGMVAVPAQLAAGGRMLFREGGQEFRQRGRRTGRAGIALGLVGLLLLAVLFVPFPRRIPAYGLLRMASTSPLVATESGRITQAADLIAPLESGQTVFSMSDAALQQQRAGVQTRLLTWRALYEAVDRKRTQLEDSAETLSLATEQLTALADEAERLETRLDDLSYQASQPGRLLLYPPAQRTGGASPDALPESNALRLENRGAFVGNGTTLGELVAGDDYELIVAIPEHWAGHVATGADVLFFLPETGGDPHHGELVELSATASRLRSDEQADLAEQRLASTLAERPGMANQPCVTARVRVHSEDAAKWAVYQTGRARIAVAPASLWQRGQEFIKRTWRNSHL